VSPAEALRPLLDVATPLGVGIIVAAVAWYGVLHLVVWGPERRAAALITDPERREALTDLLLVHTLRSHGGTVVPQPSTCEGCALLVRKLRALAGGSTDHTPR